MILSVMQPAYLPWLGYFHRVAMSDIHIVLDHVEIDKNSKTKFANRNKVRTKDGWTWLTVPLKTKGNFGRLFLNALEIDNTSSWTRKHWETIRHNYGRSPYFAEHVPYFEWVFHRTWHQVVDLTRAITRYLLDTLGIKTPLLFSSEMKIEGEKDELILNLCRAVGATVYISGPLGRNYLREELFRAAGIRILYHGYKHPTYPQTYSGFEAYMAVIDLLFNCGPKSLKIIVQDQEKIAP
jgi:hypothetical protein